MKILASVATAPLSKQAAPLSAISVHPTLTSMRSVTTAISLLGLAILSASTASAQVTVTGTVTAFEAGDPLQGVNVVVEGTTTGTITDSDGEYTIGVPGPEAVLVYSFVGYIAQREVVGDQTVIDIVMQEDVALLEDIVVVGYGEQRREAVTGSVATIDAEDANMGMVVAPTEMLQGRAAGVEVLPNSGEPGSGVRVRIRGGTSISASNEPLYVIDGMPIDNVRTEPGGASDAIGGEPPATRNPLSLLNTNDIETITVLKDAAATAIYGSRGANGVVLITTKRGETGRVSVEYEGYVSGSSLPRTFDLLSGPEYRSFLETQLNAGSIEPRDENENGVADQLEALGSADTDWQDAIKQTGVSHFHNLALSGGVANTTYRASVSYLDNKGAIISSGMDRITGRLNANTSTWNERLRLGVNLQSAYVDHDYLPAEETGGFEGGLLTNALMYNPTNPVRIDTDGDGADEFFETGRGRQGVRNPVALGEQLIDFSKTTRTLGNFTSSLDLFSGLTAQVNVGADRSQGSRRIYLPRESPVGAEWGGRALQANREHSSTTFQSYLTYNAAPTRTHELELLGGYEFNEYLTEEFAAEARDFVTDEWTVDNLEGGRLQQKPTSLKERSRLVSFFSRANYNVGDRYFLQGVLRYDGSSRFGAGNKWALFPAVSAAWNLAEEAFLRDVGGLSQMRLRVGYGITGSQEIGNYRSLALLRPDQDARAVLGDDVVTGVAPTTYANPNLKWEETAQLNVGLDYGILSGKLNGTIEFYQKNTKDLLLDIEVPQPAVVPTRLENIGEVRNRGFEMSLDALVFDRPRHSILLGAVFSANDNEVVDMGVRERILSGTVSGRGQSGVQSIIITPGQAVPTFYGPVFEGIVDGEQVFADLDGDGVFSPDEDRTFLGSPLPDWSLGFRAQGQFGDFDINLFLRGEFGRELFNNTALVFQTKSAVLQGQNFIRDALEDPDALNEAPQFSSRWIEDASFLRMDNLTLGYRLNLAGLSSQIRAARIYVSVQNLFVLTPYSGLDPEVNTAEVPDDAVGGVVYGIDYTTYPRPRTFTAGVRLSL